MAISFGFFHDAALTQPVDASNKLTATQDIAGGLGPVDKTIYFGLTNASNKVQDVASPGVASIVVSVADSDVGTGAPASEIKLALSAGGLSAAVAGASLALSTTVNGGAANSVPIYVRRASSLTVPGLYADISLATQSLIETPI